jgi:hypothetical protein
MGDRFKIEVSAERDGHVRLSGDFADCTNLTLRADEIAVVGWRENKVELVIERSGSQLL